MVQETSAGGEGLIAPRRIPNPCLESPQRMDLHRELLFNQRIGKNVLNQKSELERALSKHKEKKIMNQVKEHKETPGTSQVSFNPSLHSGLLLLAREFKRSPECSEGSKLAQDENSFILKLERVILERAKRLEQAEQPVVEDDGTNPTLQEVRARLRHAATPAASAH